MSIENLLQSAKVELYCFDEIDTTTGSGAKALADKLPVAQ
jgi:hypothetical protein